MATTATYRIRGCGGSSDDAVQVRYSRSPTSPTSPSQPSPTSVSRSFPAGLAITRSKLSTKTMGTTFRTRGTRDAGWGWARPGLGKKANIQVKVHTGFPGSCRGRALQPIRWMRWQEAELLPDSLDSSENNGAGGYKP